jgi:hypothetical protein
MSDRESYFAMWARADAENRRLKKIIDALLDDRLNHMSAIMKLEEQVSKLEDEIGRLKIIKDQP